MSELIVTVRLDDKVLSGIPMHSQTRFSMTVQQSGTILMKTVRHCYDLNSDVAYIGSSELNT